MNRRLFLAAAPLAVAGCRRDPAAALVSADDARRIASEKAARDAHLALLAGAKVPANAVRTTPPRPVDLLAVIPEARVQRRATVRLHPRFSDEPPADGGKLGGAFLWPAAEEFPTCERFKIPYVPVLQLLAEDCPSQVRFKPGSDVLQLLWSPRDHGHGLPRPLVAWRARKDVPPPHADHPPTTHALPGFVPVPCRLFPEQVLEFPDWHTLKVTPLRDKVEGWKPPGGGEPITEYSERLSVAPGTKVGGYPRWLGTPAAPSCDTCKRGMDFLLTVDADEWREASWVPTEEADRPELRTTAANAAGLSLAGNCHVFVCRRCPDWPAKSSA